MKIIIVGASGKIGTELDKALSGRHDIIRVGAHSGDRQCDYTVPGSIHDMFEEIGELVGKLVSIKNEKYGNSFHDSAYFLELLYPNGVDVDQYTDMLTLVRMFDKMKRIATDKDALG